jgi:hypothetical protein
VNEEKDILRRQDPYTITKYIKTSIDILIDLKVEERMDCLKLITNEETDLSEYEELLRKLEADIRSHIKLEHQLKLHSETLQSKLDDFEMERETFISQNKSLQDVILFNFRSSMFIKNRTKGRMRSMHLNLKLVT